MNRASAEYQAANQAFVQTSHNYVQQYSHIYCKRLLALRPSLEALLQNKYSSHQAIRIVDRVVGLQVGEMIGLVGTVFKDQLQKPCVMDQFTNDFISSAGVNQRGVKDNYFDSSKDRLLLEDESGRCLLEGAPELDFPQYLDRLLTGVVVGCFGMLNAKGVLVVSQFYFPGDCFPEKQLRAPVQHNPEPKYVLLCSGLLAGTVNSLPLALLSEYISSNASICHMIVAGGVVTPPPKDNAPSLDAKLTIEVQDGLSQTLREADVWLAEVSSTVRCDVMPGEGDPCSSSLPQQPMHACLFPVASRLNTFLRTTNPHALTIDGKKIMGHSGQPTRDGMRYVNPDTVSTMRLLQDCVLEFRHLAPTAPDTLCSYPFYDRDPFVLEGNNELDLAFAGDCKEFETGFNKGTRFVCVPNFQTANQVVLVDLNSPQLDAKTIQFEIRI